MAATSPETRDLLFELGLAEVPARFMPDVVSQLAERLGEALGEAGLGHGDVRTYGTPRRAAVVVCGLWTRQPDRTQEIRGPSVKAGIGADGEPTKAALGFARSQGLGVDRLVRRDAGGGVEYLYALKVEPGRLTAELLPEMLPRVVLGMQFPRNMRWGPYEVSFVRPIRWLLCLFGNRPLRIELPGLPPGLSEPPGSSRGHRFLAPGPVHIQSPAGYVDSLRTAGVIVDPAERRETIVRGAQKLAADAGGAVDLREDLLSELTWLSEHPTPVLGGFDAENLVLPEPVLVTVMQHHQRFLSVRRADGPGLGPWFVGVRDGGREHLPTVRSGYETVLRARLADARFFFAEDRKWLLSDREAELEDLVYQEKLGTMGDKVRRLKPLVLAIAELFELDAGSQIRAVRAAQLAKCDLVTQMVRELPELQGVMGREYALLDGEPAEVAAAIGEQYLPAGEGSTPPSTPTGLVLSVADRLDALLGHYWAGVRPTGSQDPYGMRRAAQGIVAGLLAQGRHLDLNLALDAAAEVYRAAGFAEQALETALPEVRTLLQARVSAALDEAGVAYDEISCVLGATGLPCDPVALMAAGKALAQARSEAWFRDVSAAAVRASGLGGRAATESGAAQPDPVLFESDFERELHSAHAAVAAGAAEHLAAGQFHRLLARAR